MEKAIISIANGVLGDTLPIVSDDGFVVLPEHVLVYIEGAVS